MSPVAQYIVQTGVTLLGVVALAWLLLFAGRRLGTTQSRGPMTLLGRLPLEPRRAVCLVRIGEKVLVLGTSEAGVTRLAELTASDLPEPRETPERSFSEVLKNALPRGSQRPEPDATTKREESRG